MTDDEIIAVVQAHKEGKKIEMKPNDGFPEGPWDEVERPGWNFEFMQYRVSPEPHKPREWWLILDEVLDSGTPIFRAYPEIQKGYPKTQIHVCEVLE